MQVWRWFLVGALMGCTGPEPVVPDTDEDTEVEDTDVELPIQWTDRTIETGTTLTSVYSGGEGAWVVGEDGKSWRLVSGRAQVLETGLDADIQGLWGSGDGATVELVAVGYAGAVLDLVADAWVRSEDPVLGTINFEDVDGRATDLTAVSATGIYRYDGAAWSFEDNGLNALLRAVYVAGPDEAWAVGDNGVVLRRDATGWSSVPGAPSGTDLRDVDGAGGEVYFVGNRGTMWRYNGSGFDVIETDTSINLSAVWVSTSGDVFVVGNNGLAFKYDPDAIPADAEEDDTDVVPGVITELPTGSSSNFYALEGSGEDNLWAVGNRGAVYRYTGPR